MAKPKNKTGNIKYFFRKLWRLNRPFIIELFVYSFMLLIVFFVTRLTGLWLDDDKFKETISVIEKTAIVGALSLFTFHVLAASSARYYQNYRIWNRLMLIKMIEMNYQIWNRRRAKRLIKKRLRRPKRKMRRRAKKKASDENKIDELPEKDNFWAIRPKVKAFFIRGVELIFLSAFLVFNYFSLPKASLLASLAIGIPVITSFSFILDKSYAKLSGKGKRIQEDAEQLWNDCIEYVKDK